MPIEFGRFTIYGAHEVARGTMAITIVPHDHPQLFAWWHESTREVLGLLPKSLTGKRVVDFGCGSTAILGIAMARLGAKNVTCVERNEELAELASKSLDANGVKGVIHAALAPGQHFDFMAANLGNDSMELETLMTYADRGIYVGKDGAIETW
jgi:2-polyprenyl-3-methyl-5-hydroxy-6-metoxy-1,4-benzoquinol methylase